MNRAMLIGRLTAKPELRYTTSNLPFARFFIAVNRTFSGRDGQRETDFINIVVWRGQAENCHKYLKKGSKCGVVGTLQTRSYDAQDGSKRYITEVIADEVEFLSTRNNESGAEYQAPQNKKADVAELEPIDDDSLPF